MRRQKEHTNDHCELEPGKEFRIIRSGLNVIIMACLLGVGPWLDLSAAADQKPRLLVLTDIGGDPDDQQSMIRLMVYSNEFEIEGLIASASGTPGELGRSVIKPWLIREIVEAYSMVRDNLVQHAEGYPTAGHLLARIKSGNPQRGLDAIGEGHDTEGSRWIISVVDRPDPRPVNIAIWGGQTDLAQALWRVRTQRGQAGLKAFVERIRIYDIYDQDGIANWIWKEFPGLFYVMSKAPEGHDKREAVFRGMYLGGDESLTSREWMETNIRQSHGPLGPLYPTRTWTAPNPHSAIKEGDTPSWFYFLPNGLNNPSLPNWGGWGGRFVNTGNCIFRDAKDSVEAVTDTRSTVWRWRRVFQRDFQARMDWCVKPKAEANHHPLVICNGDSTRNTVYIQARSGDTIRLSAAGSCDPDGHNLAYRWWYYYEAGTCREKVVIERCESSKADVVIPVNASNSEIHIILEVTDDGEPSLMSYRRVVISTSQPHLSATVWPGDEWPTASPESQGISSAKLAQAPSEAEIDMGDVIVIRNGYDVWHYGDAYGRQGNISSVVRSYLTTLYGIAIREGVISGGPDAMERCVNSLNSAEKGMVDLCEEKLKSTLGGAWYPKYWTKEQHKSTSYFRIYGNPSGMAYWGYLWLHRGEWKGKQVVDPWFVDRSIEPMPKPDGSGYSNGNEGWQIHLNKTGVWKGLPRDCYAAMGACDRSCILVCPSLNLVIARKGPTSSPYSDSCVDSPQRWAKPIFDAITGSCFGIGELPSGRLGHHDNYAFIWEAYVREHSPALLEVAKPIFTIFEGETITLDAGKSRRSGYLQSKVL